MRDLVRIIQADIDAALVAVAKKHKLATLKCNGGSVGSSNFMLKVEGVMGGGKTPEAERYELAETMLRLPPLGSTFTYGKHTYKTTGLNTTGSKVFGDRIPDNKPFQFPIGFVQQEKK